MLINVMHGSKNYFSRVVSFEALSLLNGPAFRSAVIRQAMDTLDVHIVYHSLMQFSNRT